MATNRSNNEGPQNDIDPIWTSSTTAQQIYTLGNIEKVSKHPEITGVTLLMAIGHKPSPLSRGFFHLSFDASSN